jgi:hypothetical protein
VGHDGCVRFLKHLGGVPLLVHHLV